MLQCIPTPPVDDPSQATIPEIANDGLTWTSMNDDTSEPDMCVDGQSHPGDTTSDHNTHQHERTSNNDKHSDQSAIDTTRPTDQNEMNDATQNAQSEQQQDHDTISTHASLQPPAERGNEIDSAIMPHTPQASAKSVRPTPPSPIGRVMHQNTSGFQDRAERSKAETSLVPES